MASTHNKLINLKQISFPLVISLCVLLFLGFSGCKSKIKLQSQENIRKTETKILEADAVFFQALSAKIKGENDRALSLFEKSLLLPGEKSAIHYEIAQIHFQKKNFTKANNHIQEALTLNPSQKWYLLLKIEIAKSIKDVSGFENAFATIIKHYPNEKQYQFTFADYYIKTQQYDKALELYHALEQKQGIHQKINHQKYVIYTIKNDGVKAKEELIKLIENYPFDMDYVIDLANIYYQQNQSATAKSTLLNALNQQYLPQLAYALGDLYYNEQQSDSALFYYTIALEDAQFKLEAKFQIIQSYLIQYSNDTTSKPELIKLLNLLAYTHPSDYQNNRFLAETYWKLTETELAIKHIGFALETKKDVYELWEAYLLMLYQAQSYAQMSSVASEALELFPLQSYLYFLKGLALEKNEQLKLAVENFENGLQLTMENQELRIKFLNALGDLYHKLEQYKQSDRVFEQLFDIQPDNSLALNNYAYYLSLRNEELAYALQLSQRSLQEEPTNPSYLDTYGWIQYQRGNYEDALIYLLKAEQNSANVNPEILAHIKVVYQKLGNTEKLIEYENKILNHQKPKA